MLLNIRRIGVCGSDVHVYHGKHPYTKYPVVRAMKPGLLQAVGGDVTGLAPGTKVTAMPQIVCGECAPCRRGDYHICDKLKVEGFQAPGCAQELWVTSAAKIIPLPYLHLRAQRVGGTDLRRGACHSRAASRRPAPVRAWPGAVSRCWVRGRSATWWRRWPAARAWRR